MILLHKISLKDPTCIYIIAYNTLLYFTWQQSTFLLKTLFYLKEVNVFNTTNSNLYQYFQPFDKKNEPDWRNFRNIAYFQNLTDPDLKQTEFDLNCQQLEKAMYVYLNLNKSLEFDCTLNSQTISQPKILVW